MTNTDILQMLKQLRDDKTSGATALVELAIDIFEAFIAQHGRHEPCFALNTLIAEVLAAQPSMAVMIDLAQHVLHACPDESSPSATMPRLQQTLLAFRQSVRESTQMLCRHALTIFPSQATVVTYSNSSTVTAALRYAGARGRIRRVLLSEARPAYDGRPQARALAEAGLTVEYSIDMGLFASMAEADLVVVGADAVFPTYFVNKIGTHALVHIANMQRIPCFVLCSTNKFLPTAASPLLHIVEHPGNEVWPEASDGIRVRNRYFEQTPLSLLRGIVNDRGSDTPETVSLMLQQQSLPPALLRLVSSGGVH